MLDNFNTFIPKLQIPHERFSVAEVPRLRGFGCFEQPEFWQIRLQEPHYFFAWGISIPKQVLGLEYPKR